LHAGSVCGWGLCRSGEQQHCLRPRCFPLASGLRGKAQRVQMRCYLLTLCPCSWVQAVHVGRLHAVAPALRRIAEGRSDSGGGGSASERWAQARETLRGGSCWLSCIIGPPLLQIATFISGTLAVRALATAEGVDALRTGGCLWFSDLTIADPTLALPLAHVALVLLNLELGLGRVTGRPSRSDGGAPTGTVQRVAMALHTGVNMTMLTLFPVMSELPAAVLVFWLSSSVTSTVNQRVRSAREPAGLAAPPPSSSLAAAASPSQGSDTAAATGSSSRGRKQPRATTASARFAHQCVGAH
jgi:hypothetical protein